MTTKCEELLKDHWAYVFSVLKIHGATDDDIEIAEFHYKTAFRHGWGHGAEDTKAPINSISDSFVKGFNDANAFLKYKYDCLPEDHPLKHVELELNHG